MFESDNFNLQNGWQKNNIVQRIRGIKEWGVKILYLQYNFIPEPISHLQHIHFTQLKELYLHRNEVVSLEGLSRMHFPSLENLHINENHIMSIRQFRKCLCPALQKLSLYANNIHDGKTLCEGAFFKINSLVVDFLQPNHPCHLTDVRFLCKLETKAVYYMRIKERLDFTNNFSQVIKEKWKNPAIFF